MSQAREISDISNISLVVDKYADMPALVESDDEESPQWHAEGHNGEPNNESRPDPISPPRLRSHKDMECAHLVAYTVETRAVPARVLVPPVLLDTMDSPMIHLIWHSTMTAHFIDFGHGAGDLLAAAAAPLLERATGIEVDTDVHLSLFNRVQ